MKWTRKQKEDARSTLKEAMVEQFSQKYGRNANDLAAWQQLCNALGADPIPDNLEDCKNVSLCQLRSQSAEVIPLFLACRPHPRQLGGLPSGSKPIQACADISFGSCAQ